MLELMAVVRTDSNWMKIGRFRCECGNEIETRVSNVRNGNTKSCGCLHKEIMKNNEFALVHDNARNGLKTPTYKSWVSMITRCNNSNCKEFKDYGGRGIIVCEDWRTFENFLKDMGERPKNTTIDRIEVNGNYEKSNCRWASTKVQGRNKRNTLYVEPNLPLKDFCEMFDVPYNKVMWRLRKGMPMDEAVRI